MYIYIYTTIDNLHQWICIFLMMTMMMMIMMIMMMMMMMMMMCAPLTVQFASEHSNYAGPITLWIPVEKTSWMLAGLCFLHLWPINFPDNIDNVLQA